MIFDPNQVLPGQTLLDPDERAGLIPGHIQFVSELNQYESQNILEAEKKYLQGRRRNGSIEDPEFLKQVHRKMFDQTWKWAGQYRRSDKNIGKEWFRIPEEVQKVCEDFRYWRDEEVFSIDEIAVRLHHRLVSIHPFPNGNGRHARLVADIFLRINDKGLLSWGSGDLFQRTPDRRAYIQALQRADQGEFAALLFFARS